MSGKLSAEMLRPLTLSPDETQMIIDEAERILTETLAASELFIANDRNLPTGDWKLVKTKESVRVYRKRKQTAVSSSAKRSSRSDDTRSVRSNSTDRTFVSDYTSSSSGHSSVDSRALRVASTTSSNRSSNGSSDSASSSASTSQSASFETEPGDRLDPAAACEQVSTEINRSKPATRPLVVATGIVPGSVEDVAFGALAHTERLWRHRDVHMQDESTDVKILASISWPTAQDPFRSLTIKWSMNRLGPLARTRDCVYIEANGIATDARGERVAYNLSHSLDCIARIPSFKHLDVVRVNLSMCYISRQHDRSSIEVFCRGFADPGGVLADSIANAVFTDMVLSIVHVVDCAYIKKLLWLAHTKRMQRQRRQAGDDDDVALLSDDSVHRCVSCRLAALGRLFGVSPAACQVCRRPICGKCRVTKKVPVETPSMRSSSSRIKTKRVTFCLCCIVEATQAPTQDAAAAMVQLVHDEWTWQALSSEPDT